MSLTIQIVATSITLLAAVATVYFAVRTRRDTAKQRRIQILALRRQYDSDLRRWADAACQSMTEAVFLCDLDPGKLPAGEFFNKRHNLLSTLSTLADQGRWFLPNVHEDAHGHHKPVAFRGFRQPSLDCVVGAHRLVAKMDYRRQTPNLEIRPKLVELKRSFVSELQKILDPREKEKETLNLLTRA
ncbi:MAG: hypothetical protein ACREBG_07055 [Pyrinomonadaceae bacterium]